MSIITIQLDTTKGDTLKGALHALMTSSRLEFPKYPEPKVDVEPNPFDENSRTEVALGKGPNGETIVDGPVIVTGVAGRPATAAELNRHQQILMANTPTFGPMDGDRKRGEPGAGHRRRTNAQIAEDEVYFKQRGHAAVATMELGTEKSSQGRYEITGQSGVEAVTLGLPSDPSSPKSAAATTQPSNESVSESLISSGGDRANPEDDAQDAADEAAESASHRGSEATLDDLRKVIGEYQKKFGMAQAAAKSLEYNGGQPIFEVPSKDIPLTIMRWKAAIEHDKPGEAAKFTPVKPSEDRKFIHESTAKGFNPESGNPVTVVHTQQIATREQVNAAINDYATKFDGSLEQAKMVNTKTDIPKLMERLFGAGKNNFNAIERTPENYGRVITAIQAEISKNTFGRTPK